VSEFCEHCGATIDQYNGELKFELGENVVITKFFDIDMPFINKPGKIVGIKRKNYPFVYHIEFLDSELNPVDIREEWLAKIGE